MDWSNKSVGLPVTTVTEQGTLGVQEKTVTKASRRTGATVRFPLQAVEEAVGDPQLLEGTDHQEQALAEVLEEEGEIEREQLN